MNAHERRDARARIALVEHAKDCPLVSCARCNHIGFAFLARIALDSKKALDALDVVMAEKEGGE